MEHFDSVQCQHAPPWPSVRCHTGATFRKCLLVSNKSSADRSRGQLVPAWDSLAQLRSAGKMSSSEKFCLKWYDFQEKIASSFHGLRDNLDFSDVTLVSEGDNQIEAHRVILSACSPFFSSVLKKNKHSHPMIYMRGLKTKDLIAIVDFIYHGEANIYQEDLDGFLSLAEELQLRGLTGSTEEEETLEEKKEPQQKMQTSKPKKIIIPKQEHEKPYNQPEPKTTVENTDEYSKWTDTSIVPVNSDKIVVSIDPNNEELKTKLTSMMENIHDGEGNKWRCTVCGKTSKDKNNVRRHVESHLEGVTHPCNRCGKISRSSQGLAIHMKRCHVD